MKNSIMKTITGTLSRAGLKLRKHSPEILIVAGVAGVVTSAIMACKATTKLQGIVDDSKEKIDGIKADHADEESDEIVTDEGKKELSSVYIHTGAELVKLYAPAILLGTMSITAIVSSNTILRKRNIALAAAYTAVDKSFKEYRGRVIEHFGEQLDKELRYGVKSKEVEKTVVDADGNEKIEKAVVDVVDDPLGSPYAKFYDSGCLGWCKDPEMNLMFLRRQQDAANEILQARKHLFLNEVYDMLGIPRTKAGQIVGWVYNEKNPNGDNYVDFGIYNTNREPNRNFVNGYEPTILLDFNVDGPIYDLI